MLIGVDISHSHVLEWQPMSTAETLAYWMRALRAGADITQAELAEQLGIHRVAISKLESGARGVKAEELAGMARVFGVEIGKFFEEPPQVAS